MVSDKRKTYLMWDVLADLTRDINADSFRDLFVDILAVSLGDQGTLWLLGNVSDFMGDLDAMRDSGVAANGDSAVAFSTALVMVAMCSANL